MSEEYRVAYEDGAADQAKRDAARISQLEQALQEARQHAQAWQAKYLADVIPATQRAEKAERERDGWKASYEADVKGARVEAAEARAERDQRTIMMNVARRERGEYAAQLDQAAALLGEVFSQPTTWPSRMDNELLERIVNFLSTSNEEGDRRESGG